MAGPTPAVGQQTPFLAVELFVLRSSSPVLSFATSVSQVKQPSPSDFVSPTVHLVCHKLDNINFSRATAAVRALMNTTAISVPRIHTSQAPQAVTRRK